MLLYTHSIYIRSLTDITDHVGYNYSHASKVFSACMGMSINQYYQKVRFQKALELLGARFTVTQVAENVRGVYVLYGGQLEFVQVFTDHSVNGYAICKTELSSEEQAALVTSSTIQLYDQVVVEGTDLYDGKVIS